MDAQQSKHRVGDADVGGVDQPPHNSDHNRSDCHRQDDSDSPEARADKLAIHQQGETEPEESFDEDAENDVLCGGPQGGEESRVLEHVQVVVGAGKSQVQPVAVLAQARNDSVSQRVHADRREGYGGRDQQDVGAGDERRPPTPGPRPSRARCDHDGYLLLVRPTTRSSRPAASNRQLSRWPPGSASGWRWICSRSSDSALAPGPR